MWNKAHCWTKLALALGTGFGIWMAWAFVGSDEGSDLRLGLRALAIRQLASPDQYQRCLEDTAHEMAARRGDLELYERGERFTRASRAMRDLERADPRATELVIQLIRADRDEAVEERLTKSSSSGDPFQPASD